MRSPLPCVLIRRRFWWLLCLVLMLPAAQAAAGWHALSHTGSVAPGDGDGKLARHLTHCELCLSAVAVTGGALTCKSEPPAGSPGIDVTAQALSSVVWLAPPVRAYLSRAPPRSP
jgi:hypothetical protein